MKATKQKFNIVKYITNISLPWLLFTLLVFSLLVKLGFWQSARADEKRQRLIRIEQLAKNDALSLAQVLTLADKHNNKVSKNINDLPIEFTGELDDHYVFLLDNQANKNSLGYRVFQLVRAKQGALLVNLGWIIGSINRQEFPVFSVKSGKYKIKGNVRIMEKGVVLQEQQFTEVTWPLRVQQIEVDKLSELIGEKLLPFVVYLDKNEQLGFAKNWHPVVMPPEKHQAYAFQWFSLATAWLLLMAWASYKNSATHKNNKGHKNEQ